MYCTRMTYYSIYNTVCLKLCLQIKIYEKAAWFVLIIHIWVSLSHGELEIETLCYQDQIFVYSTASREKHNFIIATRVKCFFKSKQYFFLIIFSQYFSIILRDNNFDAEHLQINLILGICTQVQKFSPHKKLITLWYITPHPHNRSQGPSLMNRTIWPMGGLAPLAPTNGRWGRAGRGGRNQAIMQNFPAGWQDWPGGRSSCAHTCTGHNYCSFSW